MRQLDPVRPHTILRYLVLGLALAFVAPGVSTAWADARTEARTHYQAGVKLYNAGDYKAAIREFSQAQSLAPADLNNYNLALCYDKLGDPEPAIQYYRAYLDKVPATDKRAEIEASVKRLESAAKSVAAKRAEEDRKADEARAKKAAEDARKADEAARKAAIEEEARRKADADKAGPSLGPSKPDVDAGVGVGVGVGAGASGSGTPGSGTTASTGDAQLDRVQQIDINQIRDQRVGGAASGIPDNKRGPGSATVGATGDVRGGAEVGAADPAAQTPPNGGPATSAAGPQTEPPADKPKVTPVYKKWWFWAVVGVSAYVVYSIASDDSKSSQTRLLPVGGPAPAQPGGLTLMRW
jgi:hypothetical protein